MVANPEICRQNGRKSKGPTSSKGKAISSVNATKHGLLAQKPPLVMTEDADVFQNLLESLNDEYQPQTPTEQLLVQQIAMGQLRLYRAWSAEAATIDLASLQAQWDQQYPKVASKNIQSIVESATGKSAKVILAGEKDAIATLIREIENLLSQFATNQHDVDQCSQSTLIFLQKALYECPEEIQQKSHPSKLWKSVMKLFHGVNTFLEHKQYRKELDLADLTPAFEELLTTAHARRNEIQDEEKAMAELAKKISEARKISESLQNLELIGRYESQISRQLSEAIKQLREIQKERNTRDPMGSFGSSPPLPTD